MAPPVGSTVLISLGVILLAHAAYSAHEHSVLTTSRLLSSTSSSSPHSTSSSPSAGAPAGAGVGALSAPSSLPIDIAIETLASVLLLCIGLVGTAEPLRPIRWRAWAASVDHGELRRPAANVKPQDEYKYAVGFGWVEQRPGFRDIRAEKREFAEWMKARNGGGK